MPVKENLGALRVRVTSAANAAGRKPEAIRLIAVCKQVEAANIEAAIAAGCAVFAENYVQEAKAKWTGLRARHTGLELQLIGHLQSNKAGDAVALFDCIATLDRPKLAHTLSAEMQKQKKRVALLIEVNIGDEPQKSGCGIDDVPALLKLARGELNLPVEGLMCVPPAAADPAPYFRKLAQLGKDYSLPRLSMGMSADFESAIAAGATDVRIGSALFGERVR